MISRKLLLSAAVLALGASPALALQTAAPAASAAAAPAAVTPTAGVKVLDTAGGEVGTVESISGDLAIVSTGAAKVSLPFTSFASGPNGLIIAMTRAQLEQAAGQAAAGAAAELKAALVAGTAVSGLNGAPIGAIEANDGSLVTVKTAKAAVKLPVTAFAKAANGVQISMTAAELDAAIAGTSAPASAKAAASKDATTPSSAAAPATATADAADPK